MHFDEIISAIKAADLVDVDPAGRLLLGSGCTGSVCTTWKTIDSPMENLSMYRWLMKYGHIQTDPAEVDTSPGGDPAAGTVYHPALDAADWAKFQAPLASLLPAATSAQCFSGGSFVATCAAPQTLTAADFFYAGAFLGGAADKTGRITFDLVQYLNRILKITEATPETLATLNTLPALVRDENGAIAPATSGLPWPASERFMDYSTASYLRSDWFSRSVLVLQSNGTAWVPTTVDLMTWLNFINGPMTTTAHVLPSFIASASDALRTIQFIHEYEIPADLWAQPTATTTSVDAVSVPYSVNNRTVTLRATVSSQDPTAIAGSVTFSVQTALSTPVGAPMSGTVVNGVATVAFPLPGGTAPQVLTIAALFTPSSSAFASSQGLGTLTITPAPTSTTVMPAVAPLSPSPYVLALSGTLATPSGDVVNEGLLTFTVRDSGGAVVGVPVSGTVAAGAATASYTLPGGLPAQRLVVTGDYAGTTNYAASSGTNLMAVGCAPVTILPATLPGGLVGQTYSQTLTTDGLSPEVFSIVGALPPGLTLSGAVISGVPTTSGTYSFAVDVDDFAGCAGARNYTVTILSAGAALVTGSGVRADALVRLFDAAGQLPSNYAGPTSLTPYPGLTTGVRVTQGDVTGDGVPETITAPGPGGGSRVIVHDGLTGAVVRDFWAFDYYSGGGAFVAAGDLTQDGIADIVVAQGWGPARVRVFNGANLALLRDMSPTALGTSGVRVAAGDVDGDGSADLVLGSGVGAVPVIQVYSGASGALLRNLTTFAGSLPGGLFVAAADVSGDGLADIVAGAGEGTAPRVQVFDAVTSAEIRSFLAFSPTLVAGVRVAGVDLNGDGRAEILTSGGDGAGPEVRIYDGQSGLLSVTFLAYTPSMTGGVYVGAGR
jgi:hypothetical protein